MSDYAPIGADGERPLATHSNRALAYAESKGVRPSIAERAFYCFYFVFATVVALILQANGEAIFSKLPSFGSCTGADSASCYGDVAVYRVSFALTVFYLCHALLLWGFNRYDPQDFRTTVQTSFWGAKKLLLYAFIIGSFWIPNAMFVTFSNVAVYGSSLFLLMQIILLVDFGYTWNEAWAGRDEPKWSYFILIVCGLGFLGGLAFIIVDYSMFGGDGCGANSAFITANLILGIVVIAGSILVEHGALLPACVVFFYTSFLTYSALSSAPPIDGKCNPMWQVTDDAETYVGYAIALGAVLYSCFSMSGESNKFSCAALGCCSGGEDGDAEEADPTATYSDYSFSFFHLTFAVASMYISMLFTNWDPVSAEHEHGVDRGIASFWVKMITSWVTLLLYGWSLVAPILFPDREF